MRLGLKVGSKSIGWCLYDLDTRGEPAAIVALGVRAFADGRDPRTGEPLGVERRAARARRRRRDRYLRRRAALLEVMRAHGLFPEDHVTAKRLQGLDPFDLRVAALDHPLALHHFGRALFHLSQRRGFRSNRRIERRGGETEELGIVAAGISALDTALSSRSLRSWPELVRCMGHAQGELALAAPFKRLRRHKEQGRYTYFVARRHVEAEFEAIWACQARFHPEVLTADLRERIWQIIFYQRPLARRPPGSCQLLAGEPRLAACHPAARLRRLYASVNALRVDGVVPGGRCLTLAERDRVIARLGQVAGADLALVSRWLELSAEERLIAPGQKNSQLEGDALGAALANPACFGPRWFALPFATQAEIIEMLAAEDDPLHLQQWLQSRHGLSPAAAIAIGKIALHEGYDRFGAGASRYLLEEMQCEVVSQGEALARVRRRIGIPAAAQAVREQLPYYGEILFGDMMPGEQGAGEGVEQGWGRLADCSAHIAFNQLRRLTNAILARYGKPEAIVLELAPELRLRGAEQAERERRYRVVRQTAERHSQLLQAHALADTGRNRARLVLWEAMLPGADMRTSRDCPYCGAAMTWEQLTTDVVTIDRIVPFSQSFDDTKANRILAHQVCRQHKGSRTPWQAWGQTPHWPTIAARGRALPAGGARRFVSGSSGPVTAPRLSDAIADRSRLARLAGQYLSCLYPAKTAVQVVRSGLRALVRRCWDLDELLADHCFVPNPHSGAPPNRLDYRHQTIDAAVAGALTEKQLTQIATCAAEAEARALERVVDSLPAPWPEFSSELARRLAGTYVSHRADHGQAPSSAAPGGSTSGRLHNETAYGLTGRHVRSGLPEVVHRIALQELRAADLVDPERVADPALRAALQLATAGLSGSAFSVALEEFARTDRVFQGIRRLRVRTGLNVVPITDQQGRPYKAFKGDANCRFDVWQLPCGKWVAQVITMLAAHRPMLAPERPHPAARRIMSLFQNDVIAIERSDGGREIMRVVKFAVSGQVSLAAHNEAGPLKLRSAKPAELDPFKYVSPTAGGLKRLKARQVRIDMLGRLFDPGFTGAARPARLEGQSSG